MDETSLLESWRIQCRVIIALMQRHFIAMYGRSGVGFLMLFIEPLILMVCLVALITVRKMRSHVTFPLLAFALSGWGILWICRYPINKMGSAVYGNISFLYHRYIKLLDLLISRATMLVMATLTSFIFLYAIYKAVIDDYDYDIFYIFISLIIALWYTFSMSLIAGIIATYCKMGDKILIVLSVFHAFTTGSFFMVDWVPQQYQSMLLLFPLVNVTEMMRYGMFGDRVQCHFDLMYPVICNIVLTFFMFAILFRMKRVKALYGTT